MIPMTLDALAKASAAELKGGPSSLEALGVSIDTRTLKPGDLFVALKGERADGHDFLGQALAQGAVAVLCQAGRAGTDVQPRLEAGDVLSALGRIAGAYRERLPAKVAAITGSCGKSTVKELAALLLSEAGETVRSPKSFNNAIGVPLTLFAASKSTRWVVAEIGTNAPGEIEPLTCMARPQIGAVLNIGEAHLEKLGGKEGIFREKSALWKGLDPKGTAVYCADDPWCRRAPELWEGKSVSFGVLEANAPDLLATKIEETPEGTTFEIDGLRVELPLFGRHNVLNALAAMAIGKAAGLKLAAMARRLAEAVPLDGRLAPRRFGSVLVFDDAYNANPTSVAAGLEFLGGRKCAGRKVAILGDMRELGAVSEAKHRALGERMAVSREADVLWGVGPQMRLAALEAVAKGFPKERVLISADADEAARWIRRGVKDGDTVLVKGSRAVGMDKVVEAIEKSFGAQVAARA